MFILFQCVSSSVFLSFYLYSFPFFFFFFNFYMPYSLFFFFNLWPKNIFCFLLFLYLLRNISKLTRLSREYWRKSETAGQSKAPPRRTSCRHKSRAKWQKHLYQQVECHHRHHHQLVASGCSAIWHCHWLPTNAHRTQG